MCLHEQVAQDRTTPLRRSIQAKRGSAESQIFMPITKWNPRHKEALETIGTSTKAAHARPFFESTQKERHHDEAATVARPAGGGTARQHP
jgi:hypothetical protein